MSSKVQYSVDSSVATIVLDDGKVNVLSPAMQEEIHEALDSADRTAGLVLGAIIVKSAQGETKLLLPPLSTLSESAARR